MERKYRYNNVLLLLLLFKLWGILVLQSSFNVVRQPIYKEEMKELTKIEHRRYS
jgi:hypothetical protein